MPRKGDTRSKLLKIPGYLEPSRRFFEVLHAFREAQFARALEIAKTLDELRPPIADAGTVQPLRGSLSLAVQQPDPRSSEHLPSPFDVSGFRVRYRYMGSFKNASGTYSYRSIYVPTPKNLQYTERSLYLHREKRFPTEWELEWFREHEPVLTSIRRAANAITKISSLYWYVMTEQRYAAVLSPFDDEFFSRNNSEIANELQSIMGKLGD